MNEKHFSVKAVRMRVHQLLQQALTITCSFWLSGGEMLLSNMPEAYVELSLNICSSLLFKMCTMKCSDLEFLMKCTHVTNTLIKM